MEIKIKKFTEELPNYKDFIVFVCPIEKDRWEIGWKDDYKIRIEGGESFLPSKLTYWFKLPEIPKE